MVDSSRATGGQGPAMGDAPCRPMLDLPGRRRTVHGGRWAAQVSTDPLGRLCTSMGPPYVPNNQRQPRDRNPGAHPAVRARLSNDFFDRILPISKFIVFGNFTLLASEMFLRLIGVSKSDTYLWVSSVSVALIMSLSGLAGVMVSSYLKSTASVNWEG
jgi:hypothetical protein